MTTRERVRLRFMARINPPPGDIETASKISFIPMECVGEAGGLDLQWTRRAGDVRQGYSWFREGDVLVAKITPCFENLKGAVAAGLAGGWGAGTTELHVLRPNPDVNSRWLFYLTQSHEFRKLGEAEMYGAGGQKRVPPSFILNFRVPFIAAEVQSAIANFLDAKTASIDALIEKKERLIELLQEKRQALITQAVTKGLDPDVPMKDSGIEWIGEIPAHWDLAALRSRYSVQLGKMLDSSRTGENGQYPYLRNANIRWGHIDIDDIKTMDLSPRDRERYRLRPGDLLVCEGGANIKVVGKSAIWRGELDECYYQKALHRLRPSGEGERVEFLYHVIWVAWSRGAFIADSNPNTVFHLTAEKLRAHRVPFPSPQEQSQITEFLRERLDGIDLLARRSSESVDRLREYRQALITAAVAGQVAVAVKEPTAS